MFVLPGVLASVEQCLRERPLRTGHVHNVSSPLAEGIRLDPTLFTGTGQAFLNQLVKLQATGLSRVHRRPSLSAATQAVAHPANGSSTTSPSLLSLSHKSGLALSMGQVYV